MGSNYEFDAVVIGGGSAGLTTAGIAANFGAKTMMVEARRLGGDCTWTGCVPSKTLLKAGRVAHDMKHADRYGLTATEPRVDFSRVMEHLHQTRREVYEDADRPEIFEEMGIEVVAGRAAFTDPHTITIGLQEGGERLVTARYFFICTGASAFVPPIEGLGNVDYLTNETLFELEDLPARLTIIGGGPIGTEMAQALNRLGASVTVIDMADRIQVNDEPELADRLEEILRSEGVRYRLGSQVKAVSAEGEEVVVHIERDGEAEEVRSDRVLMATGRRANVEGLGLDRAGVTYSGKGIEVDDRCRTDRRHIYACGDVTGRYQFTHMSEHMAKVAATNALLKVPMRIESGHVPWVTYTDPELGHLGATRRELEQEGSSFETYRFPYAKIDRALTESKGEGEIRIYAKKWSGKILGVDILGENAGELISEYAVAMRNGVSLREIADTIHPYPTYGLGARRAADQWYIKNQKEWLVKLIKTVFRYRGEVPDYSDPDRIV